MGHIQEVKSENSQCIRRTQIKSNGVDELFNKIIAEKTNLQNDVGFGQVSKHKSHVDMCANSANRHEQRRNAS